MGGEGDGGGILGPLSFLGVGISGPRPLLGVVCPGRVGMSRGGYVRGEWVISRGWVCLGSGYPLDIYHPSPLLALSGGHNMYDRQAGGTHPTGMHFCIIMLSTGAK